MADDPTRRPFSFARLAMLLSLACLLWAGCSGGEAPPADAAPQAEDSAPGAGLPEDVEAPDDEAEAAAMADNEQEDEPLPPGDAPFDTTYLDVNSELFIHARVAEILDSELVQALTGGDLGELDQMTQEIGIDPREMNSVTIGIVDMEGLSQKADAAMQQFNPMAGIAGGPGMGAAFPPGGGPPGEASDPAMSLDPAMMAAEPAGSAAPAGADAARRSGSTPGAAGASAAGTGGAKTVAVIRTKSPINLDELERETLERLPHGDKAYYRQTQPVADEAACLYLAEANVLVVSDEVTIKAIIDEGEERRRPTADLGFVKTLPHLLIAVASPDNKTLLKDLGSASEGTGGKRRPGSSEFPGPHDDDEAAAYEAEMAEAELPEMEMSEADDAEFGMPGPGGPQPAMPELKPDQKLFEDHTQAVALQVDLSQGIGLNVTLRCDSAESAGKVQAEIDRNLTQIRQQFETAKQSLPGVIQQIAQPLVDALAAQSSEQIVSVSTQLPQDKQSMLAMLPMAVMGMMMSGGMQLDAEFESMASRRELAQKVIDEGQPAANADELPDGLQVKALAQWGESPYGDQAPPPLEIGVVALGGPAVQAIAMGRMELTEARLEGEWPLKWLGTSLNPADGDAINGFVPIERDGMFSDHPDEGIVTGYLLAPPADAASALPSVAGQFTLQIAGRTEEVLLSDLAQLRGPVEDERLASARMSVDASRAAQGQVEISWNDSPLIGKVELVTTDGQPVPTAGTGSFSTGGRKTTTISLAGPPPQDLALRVVAHSDLQEVAVPFRFENLPLPEPPKLTDQQQSLLVWTRAEPPKDHPDLIIEAQGRWRDLEPVVPIQTMPMKGRLGGHGGRLSKDDADLSMEMEMQMEMERAMNDPGGALPDGAEGLPGQAGSAAGGSRRRPASDEPLRIIIDLIGPLAQSAEAVGDVAVTSVKTDIDTDLTFEDARIADREGNPLEGFVDITGQSPGVGETPPGALRVIVNLTPPNQTIGGIAQLNGHLKLRTVRERTETILSDLQSRIGTPDGNAPLAQKLVTDRELIKFGLKPAIAIGANEVLMRLVEGKDERISNVTLLDLNGVPITDVNATVQEGTGAARGRKVYAFQFPGGVPQKIGMKISVNMGVRDITVPIRLRDMPLPPMPQEAG